ncbi:MAG: sigma 54-interacting transcriptional regulator [Myxococcota bacterium]
MQRAFPPEVVQLLESMNPQLSAEQNERLENVLNSAFTLAQGYRAERNEVLESRRKLEAEVVQLKGQHQAVVHEREYARRERDLFRALLKSDEVPSVKNYLSQVLGALVSLTDAEKGIFILFSRPGEVRGQPVEVVTKGCEEEDIAVVWEQLELSQGIVRRALSTRSAVYTEEAIRDARFADHASVRLLRLKTVLCAPLLNREGKGLGVLYLEHRKRANAFPEQDRLLIELVMNHVSRWVSRQMLVSLASESVDHTTQHRERYGFREVVGRSEALAEVLRLITLSLDLNASTPVLISGETGTGKSVVARALHFNSRRARGPFVLFQSGQPGELLEEALLFGCSRGAVPGADRNRIGKVEEANGGTLMLKDVEKLSLEAQLRLVSLLRDGTAARVGESSGRPLDVRMIATTTADLRDCIASGSFREELFVRLDVFRIGIPPLRDRKDDIPLLAEHTLLNLGVNVDRSFTLSPEASTWLQAHPLAGNVKELQGLLARASMHAPDGTISASLLASMERRSTPLPTAEGREFPTWKEATNNFQRQLLAEALQRTDRNLQEAADMLDISRQHLSRLLHELDLNEHRPAHRGRKPRREHGG